jgi:hypothetical protein
MWSQDHVIHTERELAKLRIFNLQLKDVHINPVLGMEPSPGQCMQGKGPNCFEADS